MEQTVYRSFLQYLLSSLPVKTFLPLALKLHLIRPALK